LKNGEKKCVEERSDLVGIWILDFRFGDFRERK
jgi:hypothetical protein